MYTSFSQKRNERYKKVYSILLSQKEGWQSFDSDPTYVAFRGVLTRKTDIDNTITNLFTMYYTKELNVVKFDNIKFNSQSALFNKSDYKEMFFDMMFDCILTHKNSIKRNILFVSSKDTFAVDQMIKRKFRIRRKKLSETDSLYTGIIINVYP